MACTKPAVDSAETPLLSPRGNSKTRDFQPIRYTDKYSGLAAHEIAVLLEQVETPDVKTTFFSAYRFATAKDRLLLALAVVLAVIGGSIKAIMPILFGVFAQNFVRYIQSQEFYDYYGGYEIL
jgi:ATP-binding cassette subfamily B (MDR/TAP) protein 1